MSIPQGPSPHGSDDLPRARPGAVVAAVVCWVFAGLILLFSGVLMTATARTPEAKEAFAGVFEGYQVQVSDAALEQLLLGVGVASLALGLLIALFGLLMLGGANWTRILVIVLGALGVLFNLFVALFAVPAIVLQFLPASNAWFRVRSAQRAA